MDSVIEIQRQTHEEIEHLERAMTLLLSRPTTSHDYKLQIEHKVSQILDRISARNVALKNLYEDQEARKAELDMLSAPSSDFSEFYSRLVKIQEHHNKYPDAVAVGVGLEIDALLGEPGQEEEYEEEERKPMSCQISYPSYDSFQRSHFCSREKKFMVGTLTFTTITLLIAI